MLRHAIRLPATAHTAESKLLSHFDRAWPETQSIHIAHPLGHLCRVRIACDGRTLEIAADIAAPAGWRFTPRRDLHSWYEYDHVVVFLDPAHDHTTQRMLAVMRNGQIVRNDQWVLAGEEVSDIQSVALKLPPIQTELTVRDEAGGGWRFRLRIALASLLATAEGAPPVQFPGQPLGVRLKFAVAAPTTHIAPAWPGTDPFWKDNPVAYAELYATPPTKSARLREIDFGRPVWRTGTIGSQVTIAADVPAILRGGTATLTLTDPEGRATRVTRPWKARRGAAVITLPADYPFTSKWAPSLLRIARLAVALHDPRGRLLWSGSYPFGFDAGILVREPFGQLTGRAAQKKRPSPAARDFVDQYRAWLLTHLPGWRWATTLDGAPSDFFLRAPGRGAAARKNDLNLMSPMIYRDIARLIHRIFSPLSPTAADGWQDALCAAAMVLHHPCLTVHSGSWARVAGNSHTETVLRLGGCFCSDCARIAGRLAEEIGLLYKVPLKGFSLGLHGHLTGLVESPLGDVLIDPMLGVYYHTLDNRRLATLEEIRADKRIQQRMWTLAYNHGHEFFHRVYNQTKSPWDEGPLQFPPIGHSG